MIRRRKTTYTLEEAAQLTGYAQATLRRAIEAGDLVALSNRENERRISGVELERWWRGLEGRDAKLFSLEDRYDWPSRRNHAH